METISPAARRLGSLAGSLANTGILIGARAMRRLPRPRADQGAGTMIRVHRDIDAPRWFVYELLADPGAYADWVVGAHKVDAYDDSWPAPGATFHHCQGAPLLHIDDTTSVLVNEPPHRLLLEVRARPLLVAQVEFLLLERGPDRTRVTMLETPTSGVLRALENPVLDRLVQVRNAETLRRLEREVQRRRHAEAS